MTNTKTKISVPEEVLFREVGGEAVILNLESGKYYGLDEVGARMWALLAEHRTVDLVVESLLAEYDVDEGRLRDDLRALIDNLSEQGLLSVDPA